MKRDKITFVLFLIPIFLFPGSLKHLSFDKGENPNSSLAQQQTKSIKEGLPFYSKKDHNMKDQVPVKPRPTLSEKPREATRSTYKSRKIKRILPERPRDFLFNRAKKPNHPSIRQKIKYINEDQSFRYKGHPYVPDEVLVKFKPTISEQMIKATIEAYQSRKLKRIPRIDIYQIQIPEGTTVEEMLYVLKRNPDVEYAEPNYLRYLTITPNDTLFSEQYALYNSGQVAGPPGSPQGKERADIKATAAWEETKGDEKIIIAVLDTGVELTHPDIKNKIQSSGYDYVNDDYEAADDHWHGTHVAGIAAAETNNANGIAGVAWNCNVLPIKVAITPIDPNEPPYAPDDLIIEGIKYAADNGAHVINLSMGAPVPSQALEEALKDAYEKNIVIIAAAGNDGGAVYYPAAYDDYCLAVAATNYNDERVTFENSSDDPWYKWESNYGPEIDVAAPGLNILSIFPTELTGPGFLPYAWSSGTSMATPHVAGMAALIKSIKPWLTNAQIMKVIRYTADDINSADYPGKDDFIGYGRINMKKALVPIEIKSP